MTKEEMEKALAEIETLKTQINELASKKLELENELAKKDLAHSKAQTALTRKQVAREDFSAEQNNLNKTNLELSETKEALNQVKVDIRDVVNEYNEILNASKSQIIEDEAAATEAQQPRVPNEPTGSVAERSGTIPPQVQRPAANAQASANDQAEEVRVDALRAQSARTNANRPAPAPAVAPAAPTAPAESSKQPSNILIFGFVGLAILFAVIFFNSKQPSYLKNEVNEGFTTITTHVVSNAKSISKLEDRVNENSEKIGKTQTAVKAVGELASKAFFKEASGNTSNNQIQQQTVDGLTINNGYVFYNNIWLTIADYYCVKRAEKATNDMFK